ncbi:MAG TPA: glycosyltransferase 87 family protein [Gaiellaceae bacterium]|nr:glycosyltransferase 87 family protein [Gaiellaceae bacterium]
MRSAADPSGSWSESRRATPRPGLLTVALVFVAAAVMLGVIGMSADEGLLAWDVRFAYLPAADAVLDGRSPYPQIDDPILEEQKGYVYPPQLLVALLPLAPLPVDLAAFLVTFCLLALLGLTLYVLGVRDVRCYAAALLWVPAISGVLLANISIPLAFALAVSWRYRNAIWPPAFALGLAVSAKLLLWPIFVWMLATRRIRATVWAVLIGLGATLGAWALIGFDGLGGYPDLLRRLSEIQAERSYSIVGMTATLGLGEIVGQVLMLGIGAGLLVWCVVLGRRGDDERAFTCAVAATLVLSPIVWLHYLVALLVPLAILRPRFSLIWLLPVLLWVSPRPGYAEGYETFMPMIAAAVLVTVLLARPGPRGVAAEAPA